MIVAIAWHDGVCGDPTGNPSIMLRLAGLQVSFKRAGRRPPPFYSHFDWLGRTNHAPPSPFGGRMTDLSRIPAQRPSTPLPVPGPASATLRYLPGNSSRFSARMLGPSWSRSNRRRARNENLSPSLGVAN
jgi:hypothetical protein